MDVRVVSVVQGRSGETRGGQGRLMESRGGDGSSGGFVRSGGVQWRSEGFLGGHWSSGEVREVRVGQKRSGECMSGQEIQWKSGDVREGYELYGRSGEFRGVKWRSMDIRRVWRGPECLLK